MVAEVQRLTDSESAPGPVLGYAVGHRARYLPLLSLVIVAATRCDGR